MTSHHSPVVYPWKPADVALPGAFPVVQKPRDHLGEQRPENDHRLYRDMELADGAGRAHPPDHRQLGDGDSVLPFLREAFQHQPS